MGNIEEGANAPSFLDPGVGKQAEHCTFMRRVHHRDGHLYCVINIDFDQEIFRRNPKRFHTKAVISLLTSMPRLKIAEAHQGSPSLPPTSRLRGSSSCP